MKMAMLTPRSQCKGSFAARQIVKAGWSRVWFCASLEMSVTWQLTVVSRPCHCGV